jgi:hypothetical protein
MKRLKMLDRKVVEEFLDDEFEDVDWEVPNDITKNVLVETFCLFTEDDLAEWLKDNFKSFFSHGDIDWDIVRDKIKHYSQSS